MEKQNLLDADHRGFDGLVRLHRELDVGFYLQGYWPFRRVLDSTVTMTVEENPGETRTTITTPEGILTNLDRYSYESYSWAPVEHFIKGAEDLPALIHWFSHQHYEPDYAEAIRRRGIIGDAGIVLIYLPRNPYMQMVIEIAGVEATSYAYADEPELFGEAMDIIATRADEAAAIALGCPADAVMIPENLSSEVVGETMHTRHMCAFETKWSRAAKLAGKPLFVHMDGTLRGLLGRVAATGVDVVEALTTSPVGDVPIGALAAAADQYRKGPGAILWGGLPGVMLTPHTSESMFEQHVRDTLRVMRDGTERRFVLGIADQAPPDTIPERLSRVSQICRE